MPTFCRHNRFIERCPICSKTLPGQPDRRRGSGGNRAAADAGPRRPPSAPSAKGGGAGRRPHAASVRVYADGRRHGLDDGYGCELVPGLRSSEDTRRLLEEVAFAAERLRVLRTSPPGAYKLALELGGHGEVEQASWLCFLIAYLAPLDGDSPFDGISAAPSAQQVASLRGEQIDALPLGPRTCHEPGRGTATLRAYIAWSQRAGSQQRALVGEPSWSPERRFERIFERLAIPGFPRWGRYELLVTLGRLDLCELRADSLHLASATPADPVLAAAKRVFGIGDPLLLERRTRRLAEEISVPLEALDLALFNWFAPKRTSVGLPEGLRDEQALAQGERALRL